MSNKKHITPMMANDSHVTPMMPDNKYITPMMADNGFYGEFPKSWVKTNDPDLKPLDLEELQRQGVLGKITDIA